MGIQGIGAGFVPGILDTDLIDEVVKVSSDESVEMARRLALEEGIFAAISSAFSTAPFIPLAGSVSTSSAPKALSRMRLSMDIDAGMVSTSLYPRAAAMKARPTPVFPEVGSTKVVFPGTIFPACSAWVIML